MTARVLIATDLDRTLIYSAAAAERPVTALMPVERYRGQEISYMTVTAADRFADLAAEHVVVPVTTRTPEQLARVRLPGPPPRWAVAANGGVLLADGEPDPDWAERVQAAVGAVKPLDAAVTELSAVCDPAWSAAPRIAADLFCYVVVDRTAMPGDVVERLQAWAEPAGWAVSLQGRKLYLVPTPLTKSAAVAEVARRAGTGRTLAAGDSLLDIDLLAAADRGVRPGHGEIAESGWSAPHVEGLTATGADAGEEIVAWFAAASGMVR
jgi:hydroxymethylpyrimidine pyrophosphatase-like HAD family hydrolase